MGLRTCQAENQAAQLVKTENGFCLVGHVGFDNIMKLVDLGLEQLKTANNSKITIDLADVNQEDSSIIGLLIAWVRACKSINCNIVFINISAPIEKMLNVFGLAELISQNNRCT